jgi:hypothetical protein
MSRFVAAGLLLAALGAPVAAQPVPQPVPVPVPVPVPSPYSYPIPPAMTPVPPPPPPPPTAVPVPNPSPVPPAPTYVGPPGPAVPFQKSGGTLAGLYGYYPFDTGNYLLGDGVRSRQAGFFTMVYGGGNFPPAQAPAAAYPSPCKHRLFHR